MDKYIEIFMAASEKEYQVLHICGLLKIDWELEKQEEIEWLDSVFNI